MQCLVLNRNSLNFYTAQTHTFNVTKYNIKMKLTFTSILLLLFNFIIFSQTKHKDYIIYKDLDTIYCTIKRYGNLKMTFETNSKKIFPKINSSSSNLKKRSPLNKSTNENEKTVFLNNVVDVYIDNKSEIFKNPLNIQINNPEKGYAHVYLYRPYYYTGSALGCKVKFNGENFINIKSKSYYLHKVKANEKVVYERTNKAYLITKKRDKIEFTPEEEKIYFIKAIYGTNSKIEDDKICEGMGTSIYLDETPHSKYLILNMKKNSPKM